MKKNNSKGSNTHKRRGSVLTSRQCFVLHENFNLKSNLGDFLHYFFQTDGSVLLAIYRECPR